MGLREEIEKDELSGDKQNAWMFLGMGILFLLIGLVLQFGKNLHDSVTQASSRYSSGAVYYVRISPKPTSIALVIMSLFFFLLSYGCFRKLKIKKNNSHLKNQDHA
jgi:hypothetical protein